MTSLIRWTGIAAVLWVITFVTITVLRFSILEATGPGPEDYRMHALVEAQTALLSTGTNVVGFLAPVVQFGLIVAILIFAAQKIGILTATGQATILGTGSSYNIQAVIAFIVVGAFSLSALTGLSSHVGDLKDIALVVVGFYFGTRRREGDTEANAATAGAIAGAAAANAIGVGTPSSARSDDANPNARNS
jgi:hypothetical protein